MTKVEKAAGTLCRFCPKSDQDDYVAEKIMVSCLPAILIGLPFDDFIEKFNNWFVVAVMLIVYGVLFLVVERITMKENGENSFYCRYYLVEKQRC